MVCCRGCRRPINQDEDSDENNHRQVIAVLRKPKPPGPGYRKITSSASFHPPNNPKAGASFQKRRSSVGDIACLPFRLTKSESLASISRFFKAGSSNNAKKGGTTARSASRSSFSSNIALLRSAFGGKQDNMKEYEDAVEEPFEDDDSMDGFDKPIISFRGGSAWQALDLKRGVLALDLFWPTKKNSPFDNPFRPDIMPVKELASLCNFRNLRKLKLTGMSQSYQKYIWQTVWLNPALEELELEMALEPCIRRTFNADWPSIKGDWSYRTADEMPGVYYGESGEGELHRRAGVGEYLDKESIGEAKIRALAMGCTLDRLPIVKLTLTGFVVDADPFFMWFNPHRLRVINFKNDCVDAGFAIPRLMSDRVVVSWPNTVAEYAMQVRHVKPGEVKLIDIPKRKNKGPTQAKLIDIPKKGKNPADKADETKLVNEKVSEWRKASIGKENAAIEKAPECFSDNDDGLSRRHAFRIKGFPKASKK
ncbi:hypothetical protein GTR04_0882 [Trichophyton interdigitale]|nr:hypothetical protein GY631_6227 [Trichophyton interdigitale]KAG5217851.1 hypothetical protein GY632_6146 [Trichophyton interdigitale]KAG8211790.1 hypothetical protein GTR04_0882 [Trichophyton interdigitale]